jgi:hypothetical protein
MTRYEGKKYDDDSESPGTQAAPSFREVKVKISSESRF